MKKTARHPEFKSASYELFMLLLSLLSLLNIVLFLLPGVDPLVKGVVAIMDSIMTVFFVIDFLFRFFTAGSKREYFVHDWGWADLLASIPVQQFKVFRIFRVVKVMRLMREYGAGNVVDELRRNPGGSAVFITVFCVILLLEVGGSLIVAVEADNPEANIQTAGDGVWWAFVTITTVGYGDRFPVTAPGRLFGMLTMILGVGLFGVLTGFLANAFIPDSEPSLPAQFGPSETIEEIRRLIAEQERVTAKLKARLAGLEHAGEATDTS